MYVDVTLLIDVGLNFVVKMDFGAISQSEFLTIRAMDFSLWLRIVGNKYKGSIPVSLRKADNIFSNHGFSCTLSSNLTAVCAPVLCSVEYTGSPRR